MGYCFVYVVYNTRFETRMDCTGHLDKMCLSCGFGALLLLRGGPRPWPYIHMSTVIHNEGTPLLREAVRDPEWYHIHIFEAHHHDQCCLMWHV